MSHFHKINLLSIFIFSLTLITSCALANESKNENKINALIKQSEPPAGIVFEVVSAFEETLNTAIPKITRYSAKLRQRFPNIDIAVVSHGNEQFALTTNNKKEFQQLHHKVKRLVEQKDLTIHICASYSVIKGVSESAFPSYINVAPSGPSQINNYKELGYILIKINNL